MVWLGGVDEEEVPQAKEEVKPVKEETGRKGLSAWFGMDWIGLAWLVGVFMRSRAQ